MHTQGTWVWTWTWTRTLGMVHGPGHGPGHVQHVCGNVKIFLLRAFVLVISNLLVVLALVGCTGVRRRHRDPKCEVQLAIE